MTPAELNRELVKDIDGVVTSLLPGGKRQGNEYCAGSIHGESGESCKVRMTGHKAGIWSDFATDTKGGDLIDLWRQSKSLSMPEALKDIREYLGVEQPKFHQPPRQYKKPVMQSAPSALMIDRGLFPETARAYKVKFDGKTFTFPSYRDGELIAIKYLAKDRPGGKKKMWFEKDCEPCLFGWQAIPDNARWVAITEGEIDAMSLFEYGIPALSVPHGASGLEWIASEFDHLQRFDAIFLCFDQDQAGQKPIREIARRLGEARCRVVELPHKDANECLQKEVKTAELKKYFDRAKTFDPAELKQASSYADEVIKEFYPPGGIEPGFTLPFEKVKGKLLHRPAELTVWNGRNGHGKSQMVGLATLAAIQSGEKVCIASMELKPRILLKRLTTQAAATDHPTEQYIRAVHDWYHNKLLIFDLVGTAKAARLMEVFEYARQRYGVTQFVVDSLMKCGIAEEDYEAQKAFIERLCDFKNEHNTHVHLVTHARKSMNESQQPGKMDVKGTGAITDLADTLLILWRNKPKEEKLRTCSDLEKEELSKQPDAILTCDKQRNGAWEGKLGFYWDQKSLRFIEYPGKRPPPFVNYSVIAA